MENSSGSKKKSKEDKSGERRSWTKMEEEALLVALEELCATGWKCENGTYKAGYLGQLEKALLKSIPGTDLRATPHIESKIKAWKKTYHSLWGALTTSGISWNDSIKCLDIESDNVWETYCKKDPNAKNLRNKPFPYFDRWTTTFGKDRATCEMAEDLTEAVNETSHDVADNDPSIFIVDNNVGIEQIDVNSATQCQSERTTGTSKQKEKVTKRRRNNDDEALGEMTKAIHGFVESADKRMSMLCSRVGHDVDQSDARKMVNGELLKLLSLNRLERLRAGALIVNDNTKVDHFFSLDAEDKEAYVQMLLNEDLLFR